MSPPPGARLAATLPGRRAFLTGAASGLGLALATELARDGWTLGLLDRDAARLEAVATTLGSAGAAAVHVYAADVTDEAGFGRAVADFAARAGGLDLMVNNAGVAVAGRFEATPLADWRWALDVNVLGVVVGCRAAVPILRAQGAGLILNVASAAGFASGPQMSAYNASKAAVISITETLVQEFHGTRLRAAVAMPGFFPTNLLEAARAPADSLAAARKLMQRSNYTAGRAAADLLCACAGGRVHVVVPDRYVLLWRLKRFFPQWFLGWLPKQRP